MLHALYHCRIAEPMNKITEVDTTLYRTPFSQALADAKPGQRS